MILRLRELWTGWQWLCFVSVFFLCTHDAGFGVQCCLLGLDTLIVAAHRANMRMWWR